MPLERIIPEALRERFPRLVNDHTVGRCSGELVIFPGLPPARCQTVVLAAEGYVDEVPNPNFGSGMLRLYYCPRCAVAKRQQ